MEISNPLFLQLFIDLVLLVSIIILLWRVNVNLKKPFIKSHEEMMRELKAITAESQAASENFLQAMEQSRLALKEIALELDLKEQRVKTLLAKSEGDAGGKRTAGVPQDKYEQVVQMIKKGYSEAQVAESTGFTEPEIGLIVDLYRVKNENA